MAIPNPNLTVSSGYWSNTAPVSYHRNSTEYRIARMLQATGNRGLRKVMRALNGVAPGGAVSDTYTRVLPGTNFSVTSLGGARPIETVTGQYNGVTTAAQQTYINAAIYDALQTQPYAVDLGGNGGGGKVQK